MPHPTNPRRQRHFDYGTTTSYGSSTTPTTAEADTIAQTVGASLSGLTPGTVYHARLVAGNSDGAATGADVSFTTAERPTVATGSVGVAATTATLNGSVDPNGRATSYRFEHGSSTAYGTSTAPASAGSGTAPRAVSTTLTALTARTIYRVRLVASSSDGTATGCPRDRRGRCRARHRM